MLLPEVCGVTLGERITRARLALSARVGKHISQAELGQMVGLTGATVGNYEAGRTEPSFDIVRTMAKVLGVPAGWLAFEEGGTPGEQNALSSLPYDPTRQPVETRRPLRRSK